MSDSARWITVGELAQAFAPDSNKGKSTGGLAGETLRLHLEDGQAFECRFTTDTTLVWSPVGGKSRRASGEETYAAVEMRPGIYLLDFVRHEERTATVTLVLDLGLGIVTALFAALPAEKEAQQPLIQRVGEGRELTAVSALFLNGAVDKEFTPATPRHPETDEMVGKRVEYTYSPTERYEHIYLNRDLYTWHCLSGAEKGLADTDRCHCYKVADELYFFVWREKIIPTVGAALVDLVQMRSMGKIFGYRGGDFSQTVNFAIGSHARLLNRTKHDPM